MEYENPRKVTYPFRILTMCFSECVRLYHHSRSFITDVRGRKILHDRQPISFNTLFLCHCPWLDKKKNPRNTNVAPFSNSATSSSGFCQRQGRIS